MDISVQRRNYGGDNQSWLGSARGTNEARSITLDVSTFTKATHYPDGQLKSGLPLAKAATGGKFVLFTGDDGTKLAGFLLTPVQAPADPTTPVGGALLDDARVIAANLPVTVSALAQGTAPARFIFA